MPVGRIAAATASAAVVAAGAAWALAGTAPRPVGLAMVIGGAWLLIASFGLPRDAGERWIAAAVLAGMAVVSVSQAVSGASPVPFAVLQGALVVTGVWGIRRVLGEDRRRATEAMREARRLALLDVATGAGTASAYEQRAAAELARARRHGHGFGVARIELGGLEQVRAEHGERLAAEVLRGIAIGVSGSLRGEDYLARVEGDGFAVLLAAAAPDGAMRVVQRIRGGIEALAGLDSRLSGITAAIGLAVYPRDGESLDVLMGQADAAARRSALH